MRRGEPAEHSIYRKAEFFFSNNFRWHPPRNNADTLKEEKKSAIDSKARYFLSNATDMTNVNKIGYPVKKFRFKEKESKKKLSSLLKRNNQDIPVRRIISNAMNKNSTKLQIITQMNSRGLHDTTSTHAKKGAGSKKCSSSKNSKKSKKCHKSHHHHHNDHSHKHYHDLYFDQNLDYYSYSYLYVSSDSRDDSSSNDSSDDDHHHHSDDHQHHYPSRWTKAPTKSNHPTMTSEPTPSPSWTIFPKPPTLSPQAPTIHIPTISPYPSSIPSKNPTKCEGKQCDRAPRSSGADPLISLLLDDVKIRTTMPTFPEKTNFPTSAPATPVPTKCNGRGCEQERSRTETTSLSSSSDTKTESSLDENVSNTVQSLIPSEDQ